MRQDGNDKLESLEVYSDFKDFKYSDTSYIPIYSSIYSESKLRSTLLTATLSIRSTSFTDTTYITSIDYYNTNGTMVKSYLEGTIVLAPMQSLDYVIDRDDDTGGVGANFIVTWGAKKNTNPLFQAVMIGTTGQHGLSFIVNGISVKNK